MNIFEAVRHMADPSPESPSPLFVGSSTPPVEEPKSSIGKINKAVRLGIVASTLLTACAPEGVGPVGGIVALKQEKTPIVNDLGTADVGLSTVAAPTEMPTGTPVVTMEFPPMIKTKAEEAAKTPASTATETASSTPQPTTVTEIASPIPPVTIEPSPSPTSTPEDDGFSCDLEDAAKGLANIDKQQGGTHMIETIKQNNISSNDSDLCAYFAPEITVFKDKTIGSMLRLEGFTDEDLEKQKEAILEQCEALSFSIFDTPPPEIPGITFERFLYAGKWVDGISFDKNTDQLRLLYDSKTDQCVWKVLH